ncbi:MAG: hypothetical protein ABR499_08975 [Gemmatimonadaceae bacterium]
MRGSVRGFTVIVAAFVTGTVSCASRLVREARYPIPEQPPVQTPPELRGDEAAAAALSWSEQIEIVREVVRSFFRPRMGQARWIDPQPLSHRRRSDADSLVPADAEWATAIADAVGLLRVCALGGSDAECRGRSGGVLRFSPPYAARSDSAVVFARYTPVRQGETAASGPGFELEFHVVRRDGRWHVVSRRTIVSTAATGVG